MFSTLISTILVINELMAANVGEVMSPATNFDSWIEVYNPGEEDVNLGGMYLSNDVENLTFWKIPESVGVVPAKGFKVLWLGSDEIRSDQAPFKLDCDGGVIFLTDTDGKTNIINQTYPEAKSHTAYARKTDGGNEWGWTATPTPEATNATATFAENRMAAPVVSKGSQIFTGTLKVQVDIPMGATLMYTTDGSLPTAPKAGGESVLPWVQYVKNGDCEDTDASCLVSRNGGQNDDNFVRLYSITDGAGVNSSRGIKVHSVANPPNEWNTQFFVYTPDHVWKPNEHYRFRMKVRADKATSISVQAHRTPGDYITGGMLGGQDYEVTTEWKEISYEGNVTQNQAGHNGTSYSLQTIAFNLNKLNGTENYFYFDDISWELYNSVMAEESSKQSEDGQFTVSSTSIYTFRLFKDDCLPSVPVTRSYIQTNNKYTLPVVSIVGDKRYFTDPKIGFDCDGDGTNGALGNGQSTPKNFNQPWDRPVNFSYISPTDGMLFNQDVNISTSGGFTRSQRFRSFKLKSNKVFDGQNRFDYSFFPQKPYIRNKTLLVRNGGNDIWENNARFMDPALETIIQRSGLDVDVQSYVPVIEYVNGELRGVFNLREPNNDKYAYANWGYDDEELDAFENLEMKNGDKVVIDRIFELGEKINQAGAYDELKTLLDIDEFTNYMAVTLFLYNDDWPDNNMKAYRSRKDGRYRFVSFDLDYAFKGCWDYSEESPFANFAKFKDDNAPRTSYNKDIVNLLLNLLGHDEYRRKFIDTFCLISGSVFEPTRAGTIIDELLAKVQPMCQLMKQQGINDGHDPDRAASTIKSNLNGRSQTMAGYMKNFSYLKLGSATPQAVTISSNTPGAHILLNGIDVPYADFNGYLFQPVRLEAKAPAGYRFAGWTSSAATPTLTNLFTTGGEWKYYDQGEAGSGWKSADFNDAAWSVGKAPLGYGDKMQGVVTKINNGHPTAYFRKTVQINGTPTTDDLFQLNYQVDDGFVVYVNGQEAGRLNLSGNVGFNTYTTTYADADPFKGTLDLSPSLFKEGTNVIAVEVHNISATSSDMFWTCDLLTTVGADDGESLTNDPVIDLPNGNSVNLTAKFVPLTSEMKAEQYITPVRINEVSADDGIYVNDYFKRKDWVELYNTTDEPIDVEGMYLSDNPKEKPMKYRITKNGTQTNTIIPAHGYLVIWCDKENPVSQLHASFKIDAEGDDLMLTAADGSWNDVLTYPAHNSDQTVGRFPDGSNNVYVMNIPTIAKANITSSYVSAVEQPYRPDPASFAAGDANGDGKVDIVDVTYIVGYLKGITYSGFRFTAADANHDNEVNAADVEYIISTILGMKIPN